MGGGKDAGIGDIKPIEGFVLPPTSAIVSLTCFISIALYHLPTTATDDDGDGEHSSSNNLTMFTNRIYPEYVTVEALIGIRMFFTFICFIGLISAWITPK